MEVLEAYIKQVAYYRDRPNKQEQKDIIDIYNIFKDRLGIKSSELFYYTLWKSGGINKILLDLFITKLNLSLYDFLSMALEKNNNTYERFSYALEKYSKYITKLELTELLINIKRERIIPCDDNLVDLLVKYGAYNVTIEKLSGFFRFLKENYDFFHREYQKQRQKDRVLCRYLYNELKKTYNIKLNNVIHVTGSNGKGSTCAFIEHMLRANGYTVNKYTSPALCGLGEEIQLNDQYVDNDLFYDCAQKVMEAYERVIKDDNYKKDLEEAISSNRFDNIVVNNGNEDGVLIYSFLIPIIALIFSIKKADFNIIEVIVGGINDFTNIFTAEETAATVINNIKYGIGSNDDRMAIYNEKGEVEFSNRLATAPLPIINLC